MPRRVASRFEFERGWERADNRTSGGGARARAHARRAQGSRTQQHILEALTAHEVESRWPTLQSAIMDRVRDKGKHAETLAAVMAAAVPLRHRGTGEQAYTTQAVIDAHRAPSCSTKHVKPGPARYRQRALEERLQRLRRSGVGPGRGCSARRRGRVAKDAQPTRKTTPHGPPPAGGHSA
jgi:hypothetical protein